MSHNAETSTVKSLWSFRVSKVNSKHNFVFVTKCNPKCSSIQALGLKSSLERRRSLHTRLTQSTQVQDDATLWDSPPHLFTYSPSEAGNQTPFFILWMATDPWPDRGVWGKDRRTERVSERVWVLAVFLEFPASYARLSSWLERCQGTLCCTGAPGDNGDNKSNTERFNTIVNLRCWSLSL